MFKIRIDGVEHEVSEAVYQAFNKYDAARAATAAKADAFEADLNKERSARKDAEDPSKFAARVTARVALEKTAGAIVDGVKFDGMSDRDVKLSVISKLGGKLGSEHDDGYVAAYFDALIAHKSSDALASLRETVVVAVNADTDEPADVKARREMISGLKNSWKTKETK